MVLKNLGKLLVGGLVCLSIAFSSHVVDAVEADAANHSGFPYTSDDFTLSFFDVDEFRAYHPNANIQSLNYHAFNSQMSYPHVAGGLLVPQKVYFENAILVDIDFVYATNCGNPLYNGGYFQYHAIPFAFWTEDLRHFLSAGFEFTPNNSAFSLEYRTFDQNWCIPYLTSYIRDSDGATIFMDLGKIYDYFCDASTGYFSTWFEENEEVLARGYNYGYNDGYSSGYSAGYSAGAQSPIDFPQSITFRWRADAGVSIPVLARSWPYENSLLGSDVSFTLSAENPFFTIDRSMGYALFLRFDITDLSKPYPAFRFYFSDYSQVLSWDMVENDYIYCPTWVPSLIVDVWTNNDNTLESQFDGLMFDSRFYGDVKFGPRAEADELYSQGFNDGQQVGYESGQDAGYSQGQSEGYSWGYGAGYSAGVAAGGGTMQVIDIWGLMSAVITMPFTFFSQGLDWTLFAGSPYEFSVSIFFGSLFVILMLWKIIQLIIGLGK